MVEENGEFFCDECGAGPFKTAQALGGHGRGHVKKREKEQAKATSARPAANVEQAEPVEVTSAPQEYARVMDDEEESDTREWKSTFDPTKTKHPDVLTNLRDILYYNMVSPRAAHGVVQQFQFYEPDNVTKLGEILTNAMVPQSRAKNILDTYKNILSPPQQRTEPMQRTKMADPLTYDPAALMNMNPLERLQWAASMKQYGKNMQWMQRMMDEAMNDGARPNSMYGSSNIPPEIQVQLNKLKELEEKDRLRDAMRPFLEEVRETRRKMEELSTAKPKEQDFNSYLMQLATIKTLGGDEKIQEERLRFEARQAELQAQRDSELRRFDEHKEQMRAENSRIQIEALKAALGSKIERLQEEVADKKTAKEDILKTLQEAKRLQDGLKDLGVGGTEKEDKTMEMAGQIIGTVSEVMQPVLMEFARSRGGGGAPPPTGRAMPTLQNRAGAQAPVTKQFKCMNDACEATFPVVGDPPEVICPKCGASHTKPGAPSALPTPMATPRTASPIHSNDIGYGSMGHFNLESELSGAPGYMNSPSVDGREKLDALSDNDLASLAQSMGLNPQEFNDRHSLIDELLNLSGA